MAVVFLSIVDFMNYLLSMHDYAKIPSKVDNIHNECCESHGLDCLREFLCYTV